MTNTIVIVEDDSGLQSYLQELLLENGYSVIAFDEGISALKYITNTPPDLVILDLGLPNMDGETVCQEINKKSPNTPVIILTARDSTSDVVKGLDLGADDYITKPFVADELLARINARLRTQGANETRLAIDDLYLDSQSLEVKRGTEQIQLTPKEFKLLEYLMRNQGRILTREMILNRIWLYSPDIETRVVDVYMGYLRKKVDNGHPKKLIQSVRGFGYMIKV